MGEDTHSTKHLLSVMSFLCSEDFMKVVSDQLLFLIRQSTNLFSSHTRMGDAHDV